MLSAFVLECGYSGCRYMIAPQAKQFRALILIILEIFGGFYNMLFSILKLNKNKRSKFKVHKSTFRSILLVVTVI